MALILNLKCIENLEVKGKADKIVRTTFREYTQSSKIIQDAKGAIYFGESFEWPIARDINKDEVLSIHLYSFNKYFPSKRERLIASLDLVLQSLTQYGELQLCERMVDANNMQIQATITIDVYYYSPDGKVGKWREQEFNYPLIDQTEAPPGSEEDRNEAGEEESIRTRMETSLIDILSSDRRSVTSEQFSIIESEDGNALEIPETESHALAKKSMWKDNKLARQNIQEQELHREKDYQICISIVEGQQFAGLNVDPVIKVQVGDEIKFTTIKQSTNCPYFNEFFVFDFNTTPVLLFETMVTLTAYNATGLPGRNMLRAANIVAGSVVGIFKCDLGTVWTSPDHQFYHKWAMLLDPKDIAEGAKGFIKCDISIVGKGNDVKAPKRVVDEDNIEANLLLPVGMPLERQRAAYCVSIYRAEDLPRMDTGIMASVKKAITMSSKSAYIDAFVEVSFMGHKGKTTCHSDYDPVWKEKLTFVEMFPPLCNRMKIRLFDRDALSDDVVATHFIELNQIMDPGSDSVGMLPTFGPSWVYFYGAPREYKMVDYLNKLNNGIGEGAAYRGRLLMSINTELLDLESGVRSTVYRDKITTSVQLDVAPKCEFLLFGSIFDASMLDKHFKEKPVSFELSMGNYGNMIDAKADRFTLFDTFDADSSSEDENEDTSLIKRGKSKPAERKVLFHSTTDKTLPVTDDMKYYYIPIGRKKPCMSVVGVFEDLRKRLHHTNIILKIIERLEENLDQSRQLLKQEIEGAHRKVRLAAQFLMKDIVKYLSVWNHMGVGSGSGKTKLDKHRLISCKTQMEKIEKSARRIRFEINETNAKEKQKELREFCKKLRLLSREPQHSMPDVFVWMVVNKERVAYHRIPARDIIFSTTAESKGKLCGEIQTLFLKKPGKKRVEDGWSVETKLLLYLWLGQREPRKTVNTYLEKIPKGFDESTDEIKTANVTPPRFLAYKDELHFHMRAYLFQARNLVGTDVTGLSDPFARIIIYNRCIESQVVEATLNPTWDATLTCDDVIVHGDRRVIKENPPLILVEVYDHDFMGPPEFMGRAMVRPRVKLSEMPYERPDFPPPLQWWDIYRGPRRAGEILAAFEILENDSDVLPELPTAVQRGKDSSGSFVAQLESSIGSHMGSAPQRQNIIPIPSDIKPTLGKYRIEVLFWGVREMRRLKLLSVDSPRADMECSSNVVSSQPIDSIQKNSNFEDNVKSMDLELPDDDQYWPPITIRVVDCRTFGREVMVGNVTISDLVKYKWVPPEEKQKEVEIQRQRRLAARKRRQEEELVTQAIEKGLKPGMPGFPHYLTTLAIELGLYTPPPSKAKSGKNGKGLLNGMGDPALSNSQVAIDMPQDTTATTGSMFLPGASGAGSVTALTLPTEVPGGQINTVPACPGSIDFNLKPATKLNAVGMRKPNETGDEKKSKKKRREQIAELDWWSKYYATKEDLIEGYEDFNEYADLLDEGEESSNEEASDEEAGVDYGDLDGEKMNQLKQMQNADKEEDNDPRMKKLKKKAAKKEKRKKMKKKARERMKKMKKGIVNKAFSGDSGDPYAEMELVDEEEDKSFIARIKIYECELEKVVEFSGLSEWINTYPLFRGKKLEDDDDEVRTSGKFKGSFTIYKLDETTDKSNEDVFTNSISGFGENLKSSLAHKISPLSAALLQAPKTTLKLKTNLRNNLPHEVLIRVYIIRAVDLHPCDLNGLADPYLIVKLGKKEFTNRDDKQKNQLNPIFGTMCEFHATFPMDSVLRVQVMDYDLVSADDLIGETVIDLENRFFSRHRPTCGFPPAYEEFGYNRWRDPMKPTTILGKLCKDNDMDPPVYSHKDGSVTVNGVIFEANTMLEHESGDKEPTQEHLALEVLNHWDDIPGGYPLVPEHIETRSLYIPEKPGIEQGRIEMWVDMFPKDMPLPNTTLDITPRKPTGYELRVIIWNAADVVLEDTNPLTGEASSDIFIRGYLLGVGEDDQETDIHYRSLDGEGNFNWRFIFPFEYLKAEKKIQKIEEDGSDGDTKIPPKLNLSVWDADLVSANDFIGSLTLDLNRMPRPAKDSKNCTVAMTKTDGSVPRLNLFKQKRCRGWWPMTADDGNGDQNTLMGKVEAEFHLMTSVESEKTPVGRAREDPEALQQPNRPDSSFLWFMNPLKTLKYIIWKNYRFMILKVFLGILLTIFIGLFIYNMPGTTLQKMFGT